MTIAMIITMTVSSTLLGASVLLYWQVDKMREALLRAGRSHDLPEDPGHHAAAEGHHQGLAGQRPTRTVGGVRDQQQGLFERFREIYASAPELTSLTKGASRCRSRTGSN